MNNMIPGSIWVKGSHLYYIDESGAERRCMSYEDHGWFVRFTFRYPTVSLLISMFIGTIIGTIWGIYR